MPISAFEHFDSKLCNLPFIFPSTDYVGFSYKKNIIKHSAFI